ncbi:hypothetical protein ACS0TY_035839 [Phlomoides rotata]
MSIDDCSSPETICLQCGDKGFTNAFVYCVKCLQFAVHRDCEMEVVERCPKRLKKKLSIDNMALADQINKATSRKHELQTSDSPAPVPKDISANLTEVLSMKAAVHGIDATNTPSAMTKRLKKKLSVDNMTLADQINKATRRKHELQTSDSPALVPKDISANLTEVLSMKAALHGIDATNTPSAMTERSTLLKYKAKIKALKTEVSKMKRDKLLNTRSLNTKKLNMIKRLRMAVAKESAAKDELTRELERLKQEHMKALAVARFEGAKAFKASLAFQECVVVRALDVYEHGFNVCLAQAKRARAFREGFNASVLNPCKDEKLRFRTEVDEEPEIEGEFAELVD